MPLCEPFRHYGLRACVANHARRSPSLQAATFLAIKRQEAERFGALVVDRDYEWDLETT